MLKNCCINNEMDRSGKFSVCKTCGTKIIRINNITRECFKNEKVYQGFLKLVEKEKKRNIKVKTININPMDKI